jgi:hypothetical protein
MSPVVYFDDMDARFASWRPRLFALKGSRGSPPAILHKTCQLLACLTP